MATHVGRIGVGYYPCKMAADYLPTVTLCFDAWQCHAVMARHDGLIGHEHIAFTPPFVALSMRGEYLTCVRRSVGEGGMRGGIGATFDVCMRKC